MSVICKLAPRMPEAIGVNVMEIEQLALGAKMLPQLFAESLKSDEFTPAMAWLVSDNVVPPVFVRLMVCEAVVDPTV